MPSGQPAGYHGDTTLQGTGAVTLDLEKLAKVLNPDPVLIDLQACLPVRHIRSGCRACVRACPAQAISIEKRSITVDATLCTRCGLCMGACPTAAIQVRGLDEASLQGATGVRCAQAGGAGVEVPCLGALSVDHLVDLGSRCPGITLTAGACEACSLTGGGAKAKESLAAASAMLRALGVSEVPQWQRADAQGPQADRALTRRDLFALWRSGAVQTGRSLLPERTVNPAKLPAKVPARRLRWVRRFTADGRTERVAWPTRTVVTQALKCSGCNLCVAFCPTRALSAQESSDGTWALTFQPVACVDCHTCIDLCPRRVLVPGEPPTVAELLEGRRSELATVPASDRKATGGWFPA